MCIAAALVLLAAGCSDDSDSLSSAELPEVSEDLTSVAPAPEPDDTTTSTPEEATTTESTDAATDDADSEESTTTEEPAEESTTTSETTTTETTTTTTSTTTTTTTTTVAATATGSLEQVSLDLRRVAVLTQPVDLTFRPGTNDVFIVEQQGRVVRLPGGSADSADTTLDIRGQVSLGNEQGLLGMAFSPDGSELYVNFTDGNGATNIARYDMAGNAADAGSVELLMTIPQPAGNHNGGQLAFGPDGYLYIGMGDGGGGGDPFEHGQDPNTLHGAVLRIDVATDSGYQVPADNPFVGGGAPEVFAWGIRNAWRFDFDDANGDLWIGDVGQDRFEEVTVLRASAGGGNGANLGWSATEGAEPFRGRTVPADHVAPVITYGHSGNRCSITGGQVYRGGSIPELGGTYLYGDFCTGEIFGYRVDDSGRAVRLDVPAVDQLTSFGTDAAGEMYVLSRSGGVFQITG